MGWETVEKRCAVSWKVPDSLGIHSSGATEDLKLYADTAWVLSLRYSGYHSSPKESENDASVYILGGGGGKEWTVRGIKVIMGNAKVSNFRLRIGHFHDDDIWLLFTRMNYIQKLYTNS